MVSTEGTCRIWHEYGGVDRRLRASGPVASKDVGPAHLKVLP
jgi:hypothetical protein